MKLLRKLIFSVFLVCWLFQPLSCSKEHTGSGKGTIRVSVLDNDPVETPVPDVEITITPGDITRKTGADGTASFEVDPGDYFLKADVCCAGPGFIHYQEPVTVAADETKVIRLSACLRCL
jgi:hypothetical protein